MNNETHDEKSNHSTGLVRTMGLGALTIYGVGDMLGAGIYGTIGKAAGLMGNAIWLGFIASMVAALLTGLSYASLGSRYPRAAGASYVTQRAFNVNFLAYVVGLAVTASGLTSFATQSRAFSGYFVGFLGYSLPSATNATLPPASPMMWMLVALGFILLLSFVNFWGIKESLWMNAVCTAVEVGGVLLVIFVGMRYWGRVDLLQGPALAEGTGTTALSLGLVLQGAALTFFSFVGFEDMINVSEEVKEPERNFPRAVIMAIAIVTVVYVAMAVTVVSVVPAATLATSGQPLVDVVKVAAPWFPPAAFSLIALFAIANTGLLNYIMGSRLVYGMAKQGLLPKSLGIIHPTRRTPHRAILVLMMIVIALALVGDVSQLASATAALLLTVFIFINAALIVLQRRAGEAKGRFEIPSIVPALGIVACAALLYNTKPEALRIAGVLIMLIAALYFILRPKNVIAE
ncbi:MAG TPA: APC family permease [Abditibacteriaceae bacterium]|jgi:amino acid transporter